MARVFKISLLVCVMAFGITTTQAADAAGKIGFGVNGGLNIPAGGDVFADSSLSDFFDLGPTFGAHISYGVVKELNVRAGFSYTFMKMKDDVIGTDSEEPYFTSPYVYLDGVWNIGSMFKNPDNIWNPYVLAGPGLYFWKVTDDGAGGDAQVLSNGEELSKTSFGLHFGAGLEVFATPDLSLFAEGKYHMIFSEDEDAFGVDMPDFSNVSTIDVEVGLTYWVPLGGAN